MKKKIYDLHGPHQLAQYSQIDLIHARARLSGKTPTTADILSNLQFRILPVKVIPGEISAAIEASGLNQKVRVTKSQKDLHENRIMIEIDLTYGRDLILQKLEEVVRFYEKFTGKQVKKKKKTELDPWEIFDLYTYEKMPIRQIAHKIKKEKKDRSNIDTVQKRVENAFKRAFEILKIYGLSQGIHVTIVKDEVMIDGLIDLDSQNIQPIRFSDTPE